LPFASRSTTTLLAPVSTTKMSPFGAWRATRGRVGGERAYHEPRRGDELRVGRPGHHLRRVGRRRPGRPEVGDGEVMGLERRRLRGSRRDAGGDPEQGEERETKMTHR
jgi:hypothetical protein